MSVTYNIPQLRKLLDLAIDLGFADDVAHWKALLAEAEANREHA